MTETLFAIFMVSCSHMLGVCRENTAPVEVFESHQACEATLYRSLDRASARYEDTLPVAIGKCVTIAPAVAISEPKFDWFFARDGALFVEAIVPTEVQNAANSEMASLVTEEG